MNPIPLRLKPQAGRRRPTTAWLISGGDPSRWLLELGCWGVDESALRLYLIPTSATDLTPSALFVVLPPSLNLSSSPAGVPYGVAGGTVYLPVDAGFIPAVSEAELTALSRYDLLLFHPSLGPIGFDAKDALTVADLIAPLPRREEDWERAQPGLAAQPHLLSITIRLVSLEELFADASRDIGSDPVPLDEKPVGKDPAKLLGKAWDGLQGGMLYGLSRAMGAVPHLGLRRTLFNQIEDWVNSQRKEHLADIQARREEALNALLKQFESAPDEALKHALPLGQLGLPRGAAPPSSALGSRTPDFNLKMIGGGKPFDPWNLSPQMRTKLRSQYMKMVERERQLGRHRRAAYIYAKLLGNLGGAALMLREGRFYQEAAVLYRDHLKSPLLAADCFAEGGLYEEAIAIYREHKAWEKLALLYLRLGDEEKMRATYRIWAEQLKEQQDYVRAAGVLREKVQAGEEAYALLESAWPHHRQASLCAKKFLEWHGQAGEHAETRRFLNKAQAQDQGTPIELLWLDLLIQTKSTYPDRPIQHLAEDFGRLKIGRRFQSLHDPVDSQKFISFLVRLAPEDHLLRRDAYRRLDQARAKISTSTVKRSTPVPGKAVSVEIIREFQFPQKGVRWNQAVSTGDYFFATALNAQPTSTGREVCLARGNFEGAQQSVQWQLPPINHTVPPSFSCWSQKRSFDRIFLFQPGTVVCPLKVMPIADSFPLPVNILESPAPIQEIFTSAFSPAGTLWLCRGTKAGLHLSSYQNERTLIGDIAFDLPAPVWPYLPCLSVLERNVALSINQTLYTYETSEGLRQEKGSVQEFEQPIVGLVPCPRWTKPHLAVVMPGQVAMIWFTGAVTHAYVIDTGLDQPKVAFTKDGILVVITATEGHLFDCDGKGVRASCAFAFEGEPPVAVLPGPEVRTFATLDASGKMKIYRCGSSLFRS